MSSILITEKLAAVVKEKRAGMSLRKAASNIGGISAITLSRIEAGKTPDLDTFLRLCNWLKLEPSVFLYQEDKLENQFTLSKFSELLIQLQTGSGLTSEQADLIFHVVETMYIGFTNIDKNKI